MISLAERLGAAASEFRTLRAGALADHLGVREEDVLAAARKAGLRTFVKHHNSWIAGRWAPRSTQTLTAEARGLLPDGKPSWGLEGDQARGPAARREPA